MPDMKFTVTEATNFSNEGRVEEWVHLFLNSIGNNKAFSEGLKLEKRYWTGPIHIDISKLNRCCGPEPEMQYHNPRDEWEFEINKFVELIRSGWDMPPLIAQHEGGRLIVNDGNHRMEALNREGFEKCWVIVWNTHFQDKAEELLSLSI